MRLLKTHPILGLMNSYMVDSPQPASISYMWNFGSLLGACLVIQIITGITLAMHYTPNIDLAFVSVEHIMHSLETFTLYCDHELAFVSVEVHNLCLTPVVLPLFGKTGPQVLTREQFSSWLSGFIDGEGNFQLWFDRVYIKLAFRIKLHIDDIAVLYKIQAFLGVGRVKVHTTYCLYIIDDVNELISVLFPLLDTYVLYTTKYLDYVDFKRVVLLVSSLPSTKLTGTHLAMVNAIIANMNSTRTSIDYASIPSTVINAY